MADCVLANNLLYFASLHAECQEAEGQRDPGAGELMLAVMFK